MLTLYVNGLHLLQGKPRRPPTDPGSRVFLLLFRETETPMTKGPSTQPPYPFSLGPEQRQAILQPFQFPTWEVNSPVSLRP